jgi:hypothetical protein
MGAVKKWQAKACPTKQADSGSGGACFSLPIARLRAIISRLLWEPFVSNKRDERPQEVMVSGQSGNAG